MGIAQIAEPDRPRERLDRLGAAQLTDAELVALVLRSGGPGVNAVALAQDLLAGHGGLTGLARAPVGELAQQRQMGPAKAAGLKAALELARRLEGAAAEARVSIREAADVVAVARPHLHADGREQSLAVILDVRHRVLRVERLTVGTDARCLISARDVLSAVLRAGGAAFALVHSHPSGDPRPSPEDVSMTRELRAAAAAVGLEMLDHLIIAGSRWSSLG